LAGKKFKINLEDIAANNPKIDLTVVEKSRSFIAKRRARGIPKRGFKLAYGHSRRFVPPYPPRNPE
jgi:hypothetical protein